MADEIVKGSEPGWVWVLLKGLLTLALGVLFLTSPAGTLAALVLFLGAYWVVRGVLSVADALSGRVERRGWRLFAGIVSILAGGFVLAEPYLSAYLVPLAFVITVGAIAVISGVAYMAYGLRGGGGAATILGLLDIIFGIIVLASPYVATLALPYVLGIFAVIDGIILMGLSIALRGHQHTAHMAPA